MNLEKGILLVAFGKRGYAFSAYNFAFSIKHFNPDLPIAIYCDNTIFENIDEERRKVFDIIIPIPDEVKYDQFQRVDPANIKTSIYNILPFENTLFLDVDSLALQDLTPIFDDLKSEGGYFYSHIIGQHNISQGRVIPSMIWAYADDIWDRYNLKDDAILPSTNSSFQFIKKCEESKALFAQIRKNFLNPIPVEKLRNPWGGGQPDELYLNIALAQKGILGKTKNDYMFLGNGIDPRTMDQLQKDYRILSMFGNKNMTRPRYKEWYDKLLIAYHRDSGGKHIYKIHLISNDKHANNRTEKLPKNLQANKVLQDTFLPAKIEIKDTVLIDSNKLIQSYPAPNGKPFRVTNWLNCSFIEFKGKTYFAYRMEGAPFCTKMKIGICLLDEDLQPIKETNKVLDLHTDHPPFAKNFHAEDPRFFIYLDELYLSYVDGWQMGQAKINPETLEAENSFYIHKQYPTRTEKNWTFFQHEKDLLCSYSICPHIIYRMSNAEWEEVSRCSFEHQWKWGELRGGTSPVKYGENYISFFHSSLAKKYRGRDGRQYFMGCYIFEGKAPFKPLYISKEPIIAGELIDDSIPRFSNRIFVVFPSGLLRKEDSFLISFGYNDLQCRYVEVKDEFLKDNLAAIVYENEFPEKIEFVLPEGETWISSAIIETKIEV